MKRAVVALICMVIFMGAIGTVLVGRGTGKETFRDTETYRSQVSAVPENAELGLLGIYIE